MQDQAPSVTERASRAGSVQFVTEEDLKVRQEARSRIANASSVRHTPEMPSSAGIPTGIGANDEPSSELAYVFHQAAIGMALVAFDGTFLRVNPALCALLGRSEEELLSTTWAAVTHPDDVGPGEMLARRLEWGECETAQIEKRYVRPDGSHVWARLNISSTRRASDEPLCMFTQVVDLTHHREAELARTLLAAIADGAEDAIVGMTVNGVITAWNRGAEDIFGYSGEEIIGTSIVHLAPDDRQAELLQDLERVRQFQRVSIADAACLPKHGAPVEVSARLAPFRDASGRLSGISFIARDMTEHRWLARTLDTTLVALEQALRKARESEIRSRRFLADAAHQLRTPITGIRACAETLLRGLPKDETDRILMHLLRETARASRLMASLLRMARLDQGEPIIRKPCNLEALCADEASRACALAPSLRITLEVGEMTNERPAVDSHAVREILANLLDNARRHAVQTIGVNLRGSEDMVILEVVDDGPGLREDLVSRAFERFVSLDDQPGSGLGLPIARELARAHGGDLTWEDDRFVTRLSTEAD